MFPSIKLLIRYFVILVRLYETLVETLCPCRDNIVKYLSLTSLLAPVPTVEDVGRLTDLLAELARQTRRSPLFSVLRVDNSEGNPKSTLDTFLLTTVKEKSILPLGWIANQRRCLLWLWGNQRRRLFCPWSR